MNETTNMMKKLRLLHGGTRKIYFGYSIKLLKELKNSQLVMTKNLNNWK